MEQLTLLELAFATVPALFTPGEKFAGAIQELSLPLSHLFRLNGNICSDLLDRLEVTDRLEDYSGVELGAVGAALAQRWDPFLRRYSA